MSKALVPVTKEAWQVIQSVAPVAQASRMFGCTQEQAAIVMLKGHELGLGLASAFEFIHVIDQKPSVSPKGALALIHQSDKLAGLKIEDFADAKGNPTKCRVWMKRRNGFEYTVEFSMEDAQRAGIVKDKSGWDKYPANMLRWRAVGYCADVVFPDVIGGLYRPEELGADVSVDGEPLEAWQPIEEIADSETQSADDIEQDTLSPSEEMTINDLLEKWTAEQIMVANEGHIPATSEECTAVAEKLEAEDNTADAKMGE